MENLNNQWHEYQEMAKMQRQDWRKQFKDRFEYDAEEWELDDYMEETTREWWERCFL